MNPFTRARGWIEKRFLGGGAVGGTTFSAGSSLPAPVLSGIAVTPETALTFTAWFACLNALSTDLATVPCGVERYRQGKGRNEVPGDPRHDLLFCEPNHNMGAAEFRRTIYSHRFGWGNGYGKIIRRNGWPVEIQLQSPRDTDTWPVITKNGSIWYQTEGGRGPTIRAEDMLHLKGLGWSGLRGFSLVAMHRQGIGYGMAMEQQGSAFYGNACVPRGAVKIQKKLTDEGRKNLRESFALVHSDTTNAHRLLILEQGTEYQSLSVDPKDAEYIAGRKFQVEEMCRICQVPPPRIMDFSATTSVYKALSDMIQQYISFTLAPETVFTQSEFDRKLFTQRERAHGLRSYHDFSALMKADPVTRMSYLEKRFGLGSITRDEIRENEGDPPTGEKTGKRFFVASNYALVDPDGAPPPAPVPPPSDDDDDDDDQGDDDDQVVPVPIPPRKGRSVRGGEFIQDPKTGQMQGAAPSGGGDDSDPGGGPGDKSDGTNKVCFSKKLEEMTSQEESAVIEKYADKSEVLKSYDPVKDVDGFTHNLTVEKNVFYGRIYGEKKFQAVHSQVKTDTGKDLGSEFLKSTNKYEIALKAADHDYRLTKKEAK